MQYIKILQTNSMASVYLEKYKIFILSEHKKRRKTLKHSKLSLRSINLGKQ